MGEFEKYHPVEQPIPKPINEEGNTPELEQQPIPKPTDGNELFNTPHRKVDKLPHSMEKLLRKKMQLLNIITTIGRLKLEERNLKRDHAAEIQKFEQDKVILRSEIAALEAEFKPINTNELKESD